MPIDKGTLKGYDQLLSISQEAINRQLETLYHTPIHPPIPSGPQFLINHELNFHDMIATDSGEMMPDLDGIDGFICCPKIDFSGQALDDPREKYRVAKIRFKFRRAEDWEISEEDIEKGRSADSVWTCTEQVVNTKTRRKESVTSVININDWEVSWEALIDRKDIQNIMEDIINPANSTDSPVAVSREVQESLKKHAVDSSSFQVSTIFCAMQSGRLVRSFKLRDQHGNVPSEVTNLDGKEVKLELVLDKLILNFTRKFAHSQDTSELKGPTPDNPFVLGYTISQKKASPRAEAAYQPLYLTPKSFRCNLSPMNKFSQGTLNYCMLTHRSPAANGVPGGGSPRNVDPEADNAGQFSENAFGIVKSQASPGDCEGALFICQDIFLNHWIGDRVAPQFYVDSAFVIKAIYEMIQTKYPHRRYAHTLKWTPMNGAPICEAGDKNEYVLKEQENVSRKIIDVNAINDPTESITIDFNTEVRVKYENKQPLVDSDDDVKRRLKFTITSRTFVGLNIYRRKVVGHVANFAQDVLNDADAFIHNTAKIPVDMYADDQWEEAILAKNWINLAFTFEVGTSSSERCSFTIENVQCPHLDSSGKLMQNQGEPSTAGAPGLWQKIEMHNWASTFAFAFGEELTSATDVGKTVAESGSTRFKQAVNDLVKDLGTTVVLPAGDVFMFKGMSCDDEYNVFTTLTYDTPMGGVVTRQAAKNISWETPRRPGEEEEKN